MIFLPKHFGPLLRFLHCAMDQSVTLTLEAMDLTASQGHIMGYIAHREAPPCPKDIEDAFHLSHPTVSGILSRLEKKGFITLTPDEKDRRSKRVRLLPKGSECVSRVHQAIFRSEEQMVLGFTPEEQVQFRALLERAISNMDAWPQFSKPKEDSHL